MNWLFFPTCVSVPDASMSWTFPAVCCWLSQALLLELILEFTPAGSAFPISFVSVKDSPMCFHSTPDDLLYSSTNLFICLACNFMYPVNKQGALYRYKIFPPCSAAFFMEDVSSLPHFWGLPHCLLLNLQCFVFLQGQPDLIGKKQNKKLYFKL